MESSRLLRAVMAAGMVLLGIAVSGCSRKDPGLQIGPGAVVVAFGDSLTLGTGAEPEEAYPAVLSTLLAVPIINAGVAGEQSGAGLRRFAGMLAQHQPTLVLLCHGGNDFLRGVDGMETRQNLEAMVRMALDAGAEVLLIAVPRPGLWLRPDPLYHELARLHSIPLERDSLTRILAVPSLKSDAIHPNAAGYRELAEALAARIRTAGN